MSRFIGMIWDKSDVRSEAVARAAVKSLQSADADWKIVLAADGVQVLYAQGGAGADHIYDLYGAGVVMGKLFKRRFNDEFAPETANFTRNESSEIFSSAGRSLVQGYWGRYVAFVRGATNNCFVVRDPSGALPCYWTQSNGVTLVFSHMRDCMAVCPSRLTVNWAHVIAYLQFDRLMSKTTGFREVSQLQPGECLEVSGNELRGTFYWQPSQICQGDVLEDRSAALAAFRRATTTCVFSWASCYRRILHELSGGFDSSLVLHCLSTAPNRPEIVCFNLYTAGPDGDERPYARSGARKADCELVEFELRPDGKTLERMLRASAVPSPALTAFVSASDDFEGQLATQRGAEAVFSGQGGDHLFYNIRTVLDAAEYVQKHWLGSNLPAIVIDTAHRTHKPISAIISSAIRFGLLRVAFDPYASFAPHAFLSDAARNEDRRLAFAHPWVLDAEHLPAAKVEQIFHVVDCLYFYTRRFGNCDIVHPIISQPLIECCLRLPTYVLTSGTRDRALARSAFADALPSDVASRTSKGGTTGYHHNVLLQNAAFVREYLLEGLLVREGVFDRRLVEAALSPGEMIQGRHRASVYVGLAAEAWLRQSGKAAERLVA